MSNKFYYLSLIFLFVLLTLLCIKGISDNIFISKIYENKKSKINIIIVIKILIKYKIYT